ncbi:MAG: M48 family metalloprotease [Granulosicoccus sp.]|nr:M48 family metalloprotease [Granulosicoccus sp.]
MRVAIGKFAVVVVVALLASCAKNPVTGKNELMLVGAAWELDIGKKQYAPLRQSQGGDYEVDPGVERYVREVGNRLAAVSDRKLPYEFNVINSSVPNAWALPGGKISINRGLLTEMRSEAELAAVLAHEIVHSAAKHGARAQSRGSLLQLAAVGTAVGLSSELGAQGAQMLGSVGAQLINQSYGRKAERESDDYGMLYMSRAGYDPQGAVDLQETFVKLSGNAKKNLMTKFFASHPVSQNRVKANKARAATLPKGGTVGRDSYRKAMARLMRSKPAYDAYDEGNKIYKSNKSKSVALVKKAIRLEPKEAMFHAALGDIANNEKKYKTARTHYNRAIKLDDDYFYYFLRRGQVNQLTKNYSAAKRDLNKSIELLPTADAHALLGETALGLNDRATAVNQFKIAARDRSAVGQAAYGRLMQLDLADNPNAYIATQTGISQKGTLAVKLSNPTPKTVTGVQFTITLKSNGQSTVRRVRGVIEPGKARILDTGIKALKEHLPSYQIKVTTARVAK